MAHSDVVSRLTDVSIPLASDRAAGPSLVMAPSSALSRICDDAAASSRRDYFIVRDGIEYAGTNLIVDLIGASGIEDRDLIDATLRQCAAAAGAALLHLHLHRFTPNGGVSGVAVLAESHISFHSWPERGYAALDIFMCGGADPHRAIPVLELAFQPHRVEIVEHLRGRGV